MTTHVQVLTATLLCAVAALAADAVFRPGQFWPDNNEQPARHHQMICAPMPLAHSRGSA